MITRVGSVTLEVPDLDRSVRFFEGKVGLVVTERDEATAYLRATSRHHDMVLAASATGTTPLRPQNHAVAARTHWTPGPSTSVRSSTPASPAGT